MREYGQAAQKSSKLFLSYFFGELSQFLIKDCGNSFISLKNKFFRTELIENGFFPGTEGSNRFGDNPLKQTT